MALALRREDLQPIDQTASDQFPVSEGPIVVYDLLVRAAEAGNAKAQNEVGILYLYGRGVPQSDEEARELFEKSADQNYAPAQSNLSYMIIWDTDSDEAHDERTEQAAILLRKAADQDDTYAQACLAYMYDHGQGVTVDTDAAIELYQKAGEKGEVNALSNLGWLYEHGRGVPVDMGVAMKWYQKAADLGHEPAIEDLSRLKQEKLAKSNQNPLKQSDKRDAQSVHGDLNATAAKRVRQEGVEPMSTNALENTDHVAPVFEGTLDREMAAQALKTVQDQSGLSQRKFAASLGITESTLRAVYTGKATIDTATKYLERAGYSVQAQLTLTPIEA